MLALSGQKQIEADGGNAMREQWKEAVDDLDPAPTSDHAMMQDSNMIRQ